MSRYAEVAREMERLLRAALSPVHLEIRDESSRHAGHAGALQGGHYQVTVVSEAFEGRSLLEQHRMVNEILKDLMGAGIHALGLSTVAASRWRPGGARG